MIIIFLSEIGYKAYNNCGTMGYDASTHTTEYPKRSANSVVSHKTDDGPEINAYKHRDSHGSVDVIGVYNCDMVLINHSDYNRA